MTHTRTRHARLENVFIGDAEYTLCLRIGELIALQEKTGLGPFRLYQLIASGDWFVEHIVETLRLGLIGGGMKHQDAHNHVKNYITEGYVWEYAPKAGEVLMAALAGVEDELPADENGDESSDPLSTPLEEDSSDGVISTDSQEPQDIQPES